MKKKEQKKLLQITLKSFLVLCISIAIPFGFAFGFLTLIAAFFGGDVYANIVFLQLTGISAGFANLIVGPLTFAVLGVFFGLLSYIPFMYYLRIRKGISIIGIWEKDIHGKTDKHDTELP